MKMNSSSGGRDELREAAGILAHALLYQRLHEVLEALKSHTTADAFTVARPARLGSSTSRREPDPSASSSPASLRPARTPKTRSGTDFRR
ncbi:MAG: hypothetical protein ACKVPX_06400 [Myxococcaceae bacterium]